MTAVNAESADHVASLVIESVAASRNQNKQLLNSAEVAELIRVPEATLRYWRHVGIGPRSFKMGPRRVLYRADDVDAWVAAQYADQH